MTSSLIREAISARSLVLSFERVFTGKSITPRRAIDQKRLNRCSNGCRRSLKCRIGPADASASARVSGRVRPAVSIRIDHSFGGGGHPPDSACLRHFLTCPNRPARTQGHPSGPPAPKGPVPAGRQRQDALSGTRIVVWRAFGRRCRPRSCSYGRSVRGVFIFFRRPAYVPNLRSWPSRD